MYAAEIYKTPDDSAKLCLGEVLTEFDLRETNKKLLHLQNQHLFVYLFIGNYFMLAGIQSGFRFRLCLSKQKNKGHTETDSSVVPH